MTRPDLRALADAFYTDPTVPIAPERKHLESFARTVAAAERTKIAKELRSLCDRGFESIPLWKLRRIADELETTQ